MNMGEETQAPALADDTLVGDVHPGLFYGHRR
jgi:hypothetical protein